jgi:hypothetical protein
MMDNSSLADLLRQVAARLDASGIPWSVFSGAAATCYGVQRPITDIDISLQSEDTARILALFPDGQPKPTKHPGEYALDFGPVEIWWGTLFLKGGERLYAVPFDEPMRRRITRQTILGIDVPVCAPEDIIVLKAILQRGPEQGKHDHEDIQAIAQTLGNRLDLDYLQERASACDALARVRVCLQQLEIHLESGRLADN